MKFGAILINKINDIKLLTGLSYNNFNLIQKTKLINMKRRSTRNATEAKPAKVEKKLINSTSSDFSIDFGIKEKFNLKIVSKILC